MAASAKSDRDLEKRILSLSHVARRKSRWGHNVAYAVGGREFVHFHTEYEFDIRLTRGYQKKYVRLIRFDPRVRFRARPSEWIVFKLASQDDLTAALELIRLAWEANLSEAVARKAGARRCR